MKSDGRRSDAAVMGAGLVRGVLLVGLLLAAGCATTKEPFEPDPEIVRTAKAARRSFNNGSVEKAARLYARALQMARASDDSLEIAHNAYNLGACLISMQQYGEAESYLDEALTEFQRLDMPVTDVLLLQGRAARAQGHLDDALFLARQAIGSAKEERSRAGLVQARLLAAEVSVDRSLPEAAQKEYEEAKKSLGGDADPVLRAEVAGVSARIQVLNDKFAGAAADYDSQADLYKRAGQYRRMALAMGRAGEAYLDAGIYVPAANRFYRSARSLYAQGDELEALKMVRAALEAGEKSGDPESLRNTAALFNEIERSVAREKEERRLQEVSE